MSNKNPFEIRAELLESAKTLLENQYTFGMQVFKEYADAVRRGLVEVETSIPKCPIFPTSEQIIEQAEKFYAFVSKGSK